MTPGSSSLRQPFQGRVLGGYRIARPIATGGMATVYLARKTGPGRYAQTAAIKIIHPHLARDRELTQMFLDEARLASCVNHPNVCRVLDFGECDGTYFLAMEYVRGESWGHVLKALMVDKEGRARIPALCSYVLAQACEGLHAIHEAVDADGLPLNIVHRDVSPQNLLVAYDGSVRLLDFGIASAEGRAHTSSTEVVRGRYAYMAPEQMRGLDVDKRADIWSLGVMLREALTERDLFARDTQIATMLAVTQEPLPGWPGRVPLALREIADLALSRNAAERFPDARQMGNALQRYLTVQAEPALSAELGHTMRRLFAEQISQKRAALRELAGDDSNTDQFSSVFPLPNKPLEGSSTTPNPTEVARAARSQASRRWSLPLLLGGLFAGSLAASWLLAPSAPAPQATSQRAATSQPAAPTGALSADAPPATAELRPAREPATPAPPSSAGAADEPADGRSGAPTASDPQAGEARTRRSKPEGSEADSTRLRAKGPPGTVVIGVSQGWCEVFWRGQKLGTTPLRVELPSGNQVLEVRPYGGGSSRRVPVDVKARSTTKVRVQL